jgi:hypothetical protein
VSGISPEGVTVAPSGPLEHLSALMFEVEAADSTPARLQRLRGAALPTLLVGYAEHAAQLSPVGDQPALRVLRCIVSDEEHDVLALADLV